MLNNSHRRVETKIKQKNIHKIEYGMNYKVMRVENRNLDKNECFKVIFESFTECGRSVNFYKFQIRFVSREKKTKYFSLCRKVLGHELIYNGKWTEGNFTKVYFGNQEPHFLTHSIPSCQISQFFAAVDDDE